MSAGKSIDQPAAPGTPPESPTWPQAGTIDELDLDDAVGWITLDGGPRIRFGGTSLQDFHAANPGPGTRAQVLGAAPGHRGVLKATAVRPLVPQHRPAPRHEPPPRRTLSFAELVRSQPRWSDVERVVAPCRTDVARPVLPRHPLFEPWAAEIVASAPTCVDLRVFGTARAQAIDPTPADSFSHGRVAFLDQPTWPACGVCSRPLEMCIQLAPAVLAQFLGGGRGLAALLCFVCAVGDRCDPRGAYIRLVQGTHRVLGPESWQTASSLPPVRESQRVTAQGPAATLPDAAWLLHRSGSIESASALLLGEEVELIEVPAGVTADDLDDPLQTYDEWIDQAQQVAGHGGARLGGPPRWRLRDRTPSCRHGEMQHLLEYEGRQFLEGALHVFCCRAQTCDLTFVAER